MNAFLKLFLSMSVSGGLLILALLLGKRLLKDRLSRQWQYYIWLVVILRLLVPFGPEVNLLGRAYQAVDQAVTQAASLPQREPVQNASGSGPVSAVGIEPEHESTDPPAEDLTSVRPVQEAGTLSVNHIWLIWLAAALGLLLRKATIYQGFTRYIRAGWTPVSDIEMLDRLSTAAEQAGVKKPVELCVNPLISSPMLIGFFHPCIVLPDAELSEKDFQYIILHELTHYKRRDMFYKWLVQATACLHWFNPLVHLMSREITKACEFSCDEAVLAKIGGEYARDYGETLLDAMAAVGRYKENPGAVTLSENKQLLKERLGAIMSFKKKSTAVRCLTGVLTLCVMIGAVFVGVYPAAAADQMPDRPQISDQLKGQDARSTQKETENDTHSSKYSWMAEKYYEAGSLPLFEMAFSWLDEEEQLAWLEKIYEDEDIVFFSVAVRRLYANSSVLANFTEKVYEEGDMVFFSTLMNYMDEAELELWLDRALEDGSWAFQSMLFNRLGWEDEFDELKEEQEKEWEAAQKAEYGAVGVTIDGKNYYYQGKLVNIFLDIRKGGSFYVLNMNPKGTVNVKIVRNGNDEITGAAYMTEAEVKELFGDMDDLDDEAGMEIIPVDIKTVAAGETILLGEYTLSDGDMIWYDISAETGSRMKVFFAKDKQKDPVYWSVNNLRQPGKPLECIADFTVEPPGKPGTYQLYLQAPDGALGNVTGSISIGYAA